MRDSYIDSLIYGTTLGDAYICPYGSVRVEQSLKHQEYIHWLYSQLEPVCTSNGIKVGKSNPHPSLRFNTRTLFKDFREAFYGSKKQGKKKLPDCFEKNLNESVLALWYMDDGGRAYNVLPGRGAVLHINSFSREEGQRIQQALYNTFSLDSRLNLSRPSRERVIPHHRLYFGAKNYQRFYEIIFPTVSQIPWMLTNKLPSPVEARNRCPKLIRKVSGPLETTSREPSGNSKLFLFTYTITS
jgi:hypothetical protein